MVGRKWYIPWLWLSPALIILGIFLVYPTLDTLRLSFMNRNSTQFEGLSNYTYVLTQPTTQSAILNNLLWLVLFTGLTVGLGLIIAVLLNTVRYERYVQAAIFVPMAISFVAAGVIWRFMYAFKPAGFEQIGTINALSVSLGGSPNAWLVNIGPDFLPQPFQINNFAMIGSGVWMWTGFALVILSAALKGVSEEILEAARTDGATAWQTFRYIILPLLYPAITVVAITLAITALKQFDLVWIMTGGNFNTDVVATLMFKQMFNFRHFGRASALAIVLLLAIVPIMLVNIRRFRSEEN